MNLGKNIELKLKEHYFEEFKNIYSFNNYIKEFISFYKIKTKEFIEPILEEKYLDFLDMQVKTEKN